MPRYYCDYCDAFLTHDSPSVRKQHNSGRKHRDNVREYYGQFVSKQAQSVIDDILAKRSMAGGMPGIAGMPGMMPGMPGGMAGMPGMIPGMPFNPFMGAKPPGGGGMPPGMGMPGMGMQGMPQGMPPGMGGMPQGMPPGMGRPPPGMPPFGGGPPGGYQPPSNGYNQMMGGPPGGQQQGIQPPR
mmetsp:Transcript_38107/g.61438  ORF Transcript_38107/g.61438 Transcript_38107/m.61438 type:complete len:184 (-) Transcript_38107:311-862(-)|eukprot:CAMPEP_0179437584 /NCGR_PEP_ID=MMETSP0799-20121207/21455_1 /TAXON_ID=46947 /ORGANISM="Geminigera cryophila, Strain CCMP2564" /LENGTH=183 /DNA_ID=CAMNT_0021218623 /DNA_START=58 /DNA_END=609 /DNA_ORIENTATION=-